MRVTLAVIGSRGDVEPLVALGAALQRRGHQVRLATSVEFEDMVEDAGLEFAPVRVSTTALLSNDTGRQLLNGAGVVRQALRLRRLLEPLADVLATDLLRATNDADGLLFTPLVNIGDVASRLGVPALVVSMWPKSRTNAFPAVGFPRVNLLGGLYNRLSHIALEQLSWRPFQGVGNHVRKTIGLAPLRLGTPLGYVYKEQRPVLYPFSETVVPRPADWGAWLHVTGFWFTELPADWSPPDHLVSFLESGEPPVVVTFGSMTVWDPVRLARTVRIALRRTGRRAVLVGALDAEGVDDEMICHVRDIPYRWLFPQAAAVVHHAGAGTTAATLWAGVPSVTVPFFTDQPFWAERVHALAAGTEPIRRLSAVGLADAIEEATRDPHLAVNAERVGRQLRGEDGLGHAVDIVERHLGATVPSTSGQRQIS